MTNPYLAVIPKLDEEAALPGAPAPATPSAPTLTDTTGAPDPMELAGELGAGFIETPPDEPEPNPYIGAINERTDSQRALARVHLREALETTPEEAAKVWKLARETGFSPEGLSDPVNFKNVSDDHLTEMTSHILRNAPVALSLMAESPWMAKLMRDSLPQIAEIEESYNKAAGILHATRKKEREYSALEYAAGGGRALAAGVLEAPAMMSQGMGELYTIVARGLAAPLIAAGGRPVEDFLCTPVPFGLDPSTLFLREPGKALRQLSRDVRGDYEGFWFDFAHGLGQFGSQAALYGVYAPLGMATLVGQGAQIMAEQVDEDEAPQWRKDLAVIGGGGVMALTQTPVFDILFGKIAAPVKNRLVAAGVRALGTGAGEATQEVMENVFMDALQMGLTNPEARVELAQALERREVGETLYEGGVGFAVGAVAGAIVEAGLMRRGRVSRERAEADAAEIEKLFELAAQAPALKQDPESFAQALGEITEGSTVFVDPDRLTEVLTEAGIELSRLPSAQAAIEAGVEAGPGVEIPVSELVTALSGTGAEAALIPHIRTDPEMETLAEARAASEQAVEFFQAEAERILEAGRKGQEFVEASAAVETDLLAQLNAMQRFDPRVNEAYASLARVFYTTVADRAGVTPLQLRDGWTDAQGREHRGYRLQIMGEAAVTPSFEQELLAEARRQYEQGQITEERFLAASGEPGVAGAGVRGTTGRGEEVQDGRRDADRLGQRGVAEARGVRAPVEVGPRLTAVHNLSAENLIFADEMGGLAVPSIGVVSEQAGGVEGFGEITLLGTKGLADPSREPVFSVDAYSARFPKPVWGKASHKDAQRLVDMLRPVAEETQDRSILDQTYDRMRNRPDAGEIIGEWMRDPAVRLHWLREQGQDVEIPIQPVQTRSGLRAEHLESLRPLYETVSRQGNELPAAERDTSERRELTERVSEMMRENYRKEDPERAKKHADLMERVIEQVTANVEHTLYMDYRTVEEGPRVDRWALADRTLEAMRGRETEFKKWVEDTILPNFPEPKLQLGRRKVAYTLENIVEAMTDTTVKGREETMVFGAGRAAAAAGVQFSDVEQMREAATRAIRDPEEVAAARKEVDAKLDAYRDAVVEYTSLTDWQGKPDTWQALDASMRALAKWSTGKVRGKTELKKALKSEKFKVSQIPDKVLDQAMEAGLAMLEAPVPYFEAKPQRAVSLNEFVGAVIPADTPKAVRDILAKHGIPTAEYEGEAARAAVTRQFAASLEGALFQGQRGAFAPETLDLTLLAGADLSTFLHETGHFFLSVYTDLAVQPGAPAEIRTDLQAFLDQFADGVTPEEWAARSVDEQREAHEAFAESFEQYLFEGKAPTKELKSLFRKFTSFLVRVYGSIRHFLATSGQRAKLNPELAAVFDRMLATDAQIETARDARSYRQLFAAAADAGMTPRQFADYMELDAEAREEAQERLRVRSLRDMQWLQNRRNKTIAALQKTAKARRAEIQAEVTAEVEQEPVYRAIEFLRKGKTVDAGGNEVQVTEGFKLSIPALEAMFPEGSLSATANWRDLGTGKNGMIAKEGLDPQMVAEMFGFRSGEDLVMSLLEAQPMKVEIEGRTDQRMLEEHSELATPEGIQRAADEAIHNDARSRMVATELAALKANIGSPAALLRAAKTLAAETIGRMNSRTLRPWMFAAAETRAGKAAIEALRKGDRAEAVRQKRIELLNHVTAKQAYEAVREMEKMLGRFKRMAAAKDADTSKTRDMDTVNAIRLILAGYGFMTQARTDKAKNYLDAVLANNPEAGQFLVDSIQEALDNTKDWRQLTFDEMVGLHDTVKGLWDRARAVRQIEIDGKRVELETAQEALKAQMEKIGVPDAAVGKKHAITESEQRWMTFSSLYAKIRRVAQWARGMDGGHDGPFRRYIWYPIKDAADRYRVQRMDYIRRYRDLLQTVAANWAPGTIDARELGYVFGKDHAGIGKAELLHAILHTGNNSNKKKLLIGREWATLDPDGTLNTGPLPDGRAGWDAFIVRMIAEGKLTKADFDFVQGVWDMLEDMKPGAQKAHRAVFGRYFDEVTADSFETPWGTYRGGYVPATVDTRIVEDAELRSLAQIENENMQYAFPSSPKGFTMGRVDYNRPLLLDLRALSRHMDQVLIFSNMMPAVNDVRRVISGGGVASMLKRYDSGVMNHMLVPWLNRSAKQIVQEQSESGALLDNWLHSVRTKTGSALMFGNVTNALQQFTGVSLSMTLVEPANLGAGMAQFLSRPAETLAFIRERSLFMQDRLNNQNALMYDNVQEILLNPSLYEKATNWSMRNAYFLQIATDRILAPVVWLGAYKQALADTPKGMTESDAELRARRAADSAVQETQMDQSPEGIASFEAGSAFRRMFTQFTGWFNMSLMTMEAQLKIARRDPRVLHRHGRFLSVVMLGLFVPGVLSEIIATAMRGGPDDEDGDGYLDDWLSTVGWGTVRYGTAMVPLGGQLANAAFSSLANRPYDAKMLGTPAVGALEAGARSMGWAFQFIVDPDEALSKRPGRVIRDTGLALNAITGLPTNLLAKPIGYAADVVTENVQPTSGADFARGMITGTASPDSK